MRLLAALTLLLIACAESVPAKGPCSVEERTAIGAEYEARIALACRETSLDDCLAKHPDIKADYERKRREFVECSAR